MGCNTSQEQATVSVENENAAKADADNDLNAEADVKNESGKEVLKDTSSETAMVNGDPLGKDEGELILNYNLKFPIAILI